MRLVKRAAILLGLAAGASLMAASAALAHDDGRWDDRGWKRGHHHHHHHDRFVFERSRPVIVERPVIYRERYREVPMYPAYPPGPPSLNINIPLR